MEADRGTNTTDPSPAGTRGAAAHHPPAIGPYRILSTLGEGGFGVVYLAEQTVPVKRRVALKVLKPGMDSGQVLARFEAERQALAMMDHESVARVFDAGTTGPGPGEGRPYFVMELVQGVPITRHCDQHRLSINDRLDLFMKVCDAVQHAHQKGVIHRDLKPSNILVEYSDGKAVPKVIDFGVAKALNQKLTERTLFTEQGQLVGTPEYMSPEQAEMSAQDIDTRSDIYSLGVLLYELLTGTLPFNPDTLRSAALTEIQRIIREVEPQKPSTRLSAMATQDGRSMNPERERRAAAVQADGGGEINQPSPAYQLQPTARTTAPLAEIASQRQSDPRTLLRTIRGDLDWIVMKCLEKDRARRYETANALAMELRRHLSHEPVLAGPPSVAYRMRKFARRNRGSLAAGALVACAMLAGTAVSLWFAVRESEQRRITERAREDEAKQRGIAEKNAERARTEAARAVQERDKAEIIAEFMADTFSGIDASIALGRDTTMLREMMDRSASRISEGHLRGSLEAERRVRLTIGDVYRGIAEFARAEAILKPVVEMAISSGRESPDPVLAEGLGLWAGYLYDTGRLEEAEDYAQRSLTMYRELHAGDHRDVASGLQAVAFIKKSRGNYAEAEGLYLESLEMSRRLKGGDDPATARVLTDLGETYRLLGRLPDAETFSAQALAMRERLFPGDHPDVAVSLVNLAVLHELFGRASLAEPLFVRAADMLRRLHPDGHPTLGMALSHLGGVRNALGKFAEAEGALDDAVRMLRKFHSGDQQDLAGAVGGLGAIRLALGKAADAEPLLRDAVEMKRRLYGGDHVDLAIEISNLASAVQARGRLLEAEPLFQESLDMTRRLVGGDHQSMISRLSALGGVRLALGRAKDAEPLLREALEMAQRLYPANHPVVASGLANLGSVRRELDDPEGARELYLRALDLLRGLYPGDHPSLANLLNNLADINHRLGRPGDAVPLFEECLAMNRRLYGDTHPAVAKTLNNLAYSLLALGRASDAVPLLEEAVEIFRRLGRDDHPDRAAAMVHLAEALRRLGNSDDASSLLQQALDMRRRLFGQEHVMVAVTLSSLGELQRQTGRHDEAARLFDDCLAMYRRLHPGDHVNVAISLFNAGQARQDLGAATDAEPLLRECLAMQERLVDVSHRLAWQRHRTQSVLAHVLVELGARATTVGERARRYDEAEQLLIRAAEGFGNQPSLDAAPERASWQRTAIQDLAQLFTTRHAADPAAGYDAKAVEWTAKLDALPK